MFLVQSHISQIITNLVIAEGSVHLELRYFIRLSDNAYLAFIGADYLVCMIKILIAPTIRKSKNTEHIGVPYNIFHVYMTTHRDRADGDF